MTTDERIDAIARRLDELTAILLRAEERQDRQIENINAQSDKFNAQIDTINATLNRAIRLGIREARQERAKRRELEAKLDDKLTQLAAAQLVTEEKLQRFLQRSPNGSSGSGQK